MLRDIREFESHRLRQTANKRLSGRFFVAPVIPAVNSGPARPLFIFTTGPLPGNWFFSDPPSWLVLQRFRPKHDGLQVACCGFAEHPILRTSFYDQQWPRLSLKMKTPDEVYRASIVAFHQSEIGLAGVRLVLDGAMNCRRSLE